MIKRALISVSDKNGIVEFTRSLTDAGVEILSTGGTAKLLRDNQIDVVDVSEYTGFPEMMDGRVKTLHPKIHGALLAVRENEEHMKSAQEHGISPIDLVAVNLYPFETTVKNPDVQLEEAIEQIDIGGPSMLRSAAKNFKYVTVVTDPADYSRVIEEMQANGGDTTPETRKNLAEKVFLATARYDTSIANYLTGGRLKTMTFEKINDLRYGENPHQKAAYYKELGLAPDYTCIPNAEIIQGKALSYNNIMDADAALNIVRECEKPCVTFVKHSNPCGAASSDSITEAFINAYESDPKSAFGGIIAMNRPCTKDFADTITQKFFEIVLAPDFDEDAIEIFKRKPNLRILRTGEMKLREASLTERKISGGILIQDTDISHLKKEDLMVMTKKKPTEKEIEDMLFAWHIVKYVKSNAIVLTKDQMTVGIGAGQMSRVDAVELAIKKGGGREKGAVLASDAFFPFPDSIEEAVKAGVTAIIHPGGSIKDKDVVEAADRLGAAMVITGVRSFLH